MKINLNCGYLMLLGCSLPLIPLQAQLVIGDDGLPLDSNYTAVQSLVAATGLTASENTWFNITSGVDFGFSAAGNHVKLTTGTMEGNDPATFVPAHVQFVVAADFTADSVWFAAGRTRFDGNARLNNAGTLYVAGGQIWFYGYAATLSNPIVLGTAIYEEGNSNFSKASFRLETSATLNGTVSVVSPVKFAFNSNATLTLANLEGSEDLTFVRGTPPAKAYIKAMDAYTGNLITAPGVTLQLGESVTTLPPFTIQDADLISEATEPVTISGTSALSNGVISLAQVPMSETTAALIVPDGAQLTLSGDITVDIGTAYTFPVTLKIVDVQSGGVLEGWDPDAIAFRSGNFLLTSTPNPDGTVTLTREIDSVSFTIPSADWDGKVLPTEALGFIVTGNKGFGQDPTFDQQLNDKTSTVVKITDSSNSNARLFGLHVVGNGTGSTENRDIWLNMTGGQVQLIVGGPENHWQSNHYSSLNGDILIDVKGNSQLTGIVGGIFKSGYSGGKITGNIGIVVEEDAVITGSIVGGTASAHNQQAQIQGNVAVLIKNIQPTAGSGNAIENLPAGYIIGGNAWIANTTSSGTITGNTTVQVSLPPAASGTFQKTLVGASYANTSSTSTPASSQNGTASVIIDAPDTVTFNRPIYGGGMAVETATSSVTTSSVVIHGGTFPSTVAAGGSGAGASVSGDASLTLNGGIFTGALTGAADGGTTGSATLIIGGTPTLSQATLSDFTNLTIQPDGVLDHPAAYTFTGGAVFEEGSKLCVTPSTDATGLLTIDGFISGSVEIVFPEGFNGATGNRYYVLKGAGTTLNTVKEKEKYYTRKDDTGVYYSKKEGSIIVLF